MRRLLFTLILGAAPSLVHAQAAEIPVGSVVRVTAPTLGRGRITGTVQAWRGDTLVIAPVASLGRVDIPPGALRSLERAVGESRRRHVATGVGATIGGVLGASVGALVMIVQSTSSQTETSRRPMRATPVVAGALVGGALGGTVGWQVRPRVWETVRLPSRPR